MIGPFDAKSVGEAWRSGLDAVMRTQSQVTQAWVQGMEAFAAGRGAGGEGEAGGAEAGVGEAGRGEAGRGEAGVGEAGAELAQATQAMAELWSAAGALFTAVSRSVAGGVAGGGSGGSESAAAEATMARMLSPSSWLSGAGEMEEVLGRMAEGPRLADLWDVERRSARVTRAWLETRRAGVGHQAVMLEAWMAAGRTFNAAWHEGGAARQQKPEEAFKAALALWTEIANAELLRVQRSERFLASQAAMIRASTELRLAQQELVEHYGKQYGFPTRTELDDVHRTVTEMRRELRALKRELARRDAGAAGAVAPVPSGVEVAVPVGVAAGSKRGRRR